MKLSNVWGIIVFAFLVVSCDGGSSNKGDELFDQGKYKEAIEEYSRDIESSSSNIKTVYSRGRAYQELGDLAKAEADFASIVKMDDKNINAKMSLSKLYYEKELYNKAVIWAEQALDINENTAQAHFLAARAKHQLGYVDGAFESYTAAIDLDNNFGEAYLYRGALKIHMGKEKGACSDFNKARALEVKEAPSIIKKYCK
ncbi:MAG: tetratricopeptide repeat protein [Cyclobacteriaceae bacterium]